MYTWGGSITLTAIYIQKYPDLMISDPLPSSFYANPDVVAAAKAFLGKRIFSMVDGELCSGIITETEAYCGRNDKACHANNGLRTARTEIMYGEPGRAYIYLCYGIHHLFNIVTNRKGLADAVLIRAVEPVDGLEVMKQRRQTRQIRNLTNGPGKWTQAFGITTRLNKVSLSVPPVWIENSSITPSNIIESPRIGIDYAGEDALRLWRFQLDGTADFQKK